MLRRNIRALVVALIVVVSLAPVTGAATQAEEPSVTLAGATIDVEAGEETTSVEATYEFAVESTGSGDAELTAFNGTFWEFREESISDISATVNGEEVEPEVNREENHVDVSVPAENVEDSETVTVTLKYQVDGPSGTVKAPLWVPEYNTAGTDRVVEMTVTLPEDQRHQGDNFPKPDRVTNDGNVLEYDLLHMPAFVRSEYGSSEPGLLDLTEMVSLGGVLFIVGFMGVWIAWVNGYIGSRQEETDVA